MTNAEYEAELWHVLETAAPCENLLHLLEKAFSAPILLCHAANQLLLQSEGLVERQYAHIKEIRMLGRARMQELALKKGNVHGAEPYLFEVPGGMVYMCASALDSNGGLCGTVNVLVKAGHSITEEENMRLRQAARCLSLALRLEENAKEVEDTHAGWNYFLRQMLEKKISSREAMLNVLCSSSGLYVPQAVCLATLSAHGKTMAASSFRRYYRALAALPACLAVIPWESRILALFESTEAGLQMVVKSVGKLSRENFLKAVCSEAEKDLWNLPFLYKKNERAIRYAQKYSSPGEVITYEDCILYDMVSHTASPTGSLDFFVPRKIKAMRRMDEKENTNYYVTLRTYLECFYDRTQTAAQLFIHKTTLSYRLGRMSELFQIDWNNYEEMTKLICGVYLVENFL